jgi:hypothetical protein
MVGSFSQTLEALLSLELLDLYLWVFKLVCAMHVLVDYLPTGALGKHLQGLFWVRSELVLRKSLSCRPMLPFVDRNRLQLRKHLATRLWNYVLVLGAEGCLLGVLKTFEWVVFYEAGCGTEAVLHVGRGHLDARDGDFVSDRLALHLFNSLPFSWLLYSGP